MRNFAGAMLSHCSPIAHHARHPPTLPRASVPYFAPPHTRTSINWHLNLMQTLRGKHSKTISQVFAMLASSKLTPSMVQVRVVVLVPLRFWLGWIFQHTSYLPVNVLRMTTVGMVVVSATGDSTDPVA